MTAAVSRRPLAVANWKMYLDAKESLRAADILKGVQPALLSHVDMVVAPSFPLLSQVANIFKGTGILLAAQTVHEEEEGAFTGDVSVGELSGLVRFVLVGHSERRRYHHETDDQVAFKTRRVLHAGMHPIICVGETQEEHDAGRTIEVIRMQVECVLRDLPALDIPRLVFAYEPVWAISPGMGQSAPQPDALEVAEIGGLIRKIATEQSRVEYAEKIRILYGGSVHADNVQPFVSQPGIDGVLAGSASTKPAEFIAIIERILQCHIS